MHDKRSCAIIGCMNIQGGKNSNALISFAALIVVIYGMQMAKELLIPFIIASFLTLLAYRPMMWLHNKLYILNPNNPPIFLPALIIVFLMMLLLVIIGGVLGSSIGDFTAALPGYQQRLEVMKEGFVEFAIRFFNLDKSIENLSEMIDPGWAMELVVLILNSLKDALTNAFLIIFTMVFMLLEATSLSAKFKAAFSGNKDLLNRPQVFIESLGRYLGIKTAVSAATGVCTGILTWSLGLDFPLLWAMLAFLLNYIPTIGSIIAAVPVILLGLIQFGPGIAIATAVGFALINIVFGSAIEPRLMGYGVGISPLVVFISLVFWGWVFGPVGMLLSVPLTMALKLVLESDIRTKWIAILIGSERDANYELRARNSSKD
jgi:predicted PurR-regulated permease PerM